MEQPPDYQEYRQFIVSNLSLQRRPLGLFTLPQKNGERGRSA